MFRCVVSCFVLFSSLSLVFADQAFLAPYGSYNQLFQYADGSTSVNQTMQLRMADTLSSGRLQVGDYVLSIQSLPPVLTYRSRQIGTVPKTTTMHQEEVCLLQSTLARAVADDLLNAQSFNVSTIADVHSSRRLLWHQRTTLPSAVNDDSVTTKGRLYTEWCGLQQWSYVKERWQQFLRVCTLDCGFIFGGSGCSDDVWENMHSRESPCKNTVGWWSRAFTQLKSGSLSDKARAYLAEVTSVYGESPHNVVLTMRAWIERDRTVMSDEFGAMKTAFCYDMPGRCFTSGYQDQTTDENHDKAACALVVKNYNRGIFSSQGYEASDIGAASLEAFTALQKTIAESLAAQALQNSAAAAFANQTGIAIASISKSLQAQDAINKKAAQLASQQDGLNQVFTNELGATQTQIQLLYSTSKNSTDMLLNALDAQYIALNSASDATNAAVNAKFGVLGKTLKGIMQQQTDQFQQLYKGILQTSESVQGVAGILDAFIRQRQYNRLMTASFYESAAALTTGEVALVSRDGVKPGELTTADLRALLDSITIVYAPTPLAVTTVQLDFYMDTVSMLSNARPWTTVEQMFIWMGSSSCSLRPAEASTGKYCMFWATSTVRECASSFNWDTLRCGGLSTTSATTSVLSLPALQTVLATHCVKSAQNNQYTLLSAMLNLKLAVTRNTSLCDASVQQLQLNQAVGQPSVLMTLFSYLWMSYAGPFQILMQSLELKRYGRLPDGIKTEMQSLGYTPQSSSQFGGTGNVQCMRGYWLSVSKETLSITSLTYDSSSSADEQVIAHVESAPECVSNCYAVQDSDLTINYVIQDSTGFTMPTSMVVIGSIGASQYSGIYDVPTAMIETTANPLLRSNLLSYLLMPANVTQTLDFEFFRSTSGGLFDAYAGSASASEFLYPAILDDFGYPLCNVAGALPVSATYASVDGLCIPPFYWSGEAYASNTYSVAPPVSAGDCTLPDPLPGTTAIYLRSELSPGENMFLSSDIAAVDALMNANNHRFSFSAWITMRTPSFTNTPLVSFNVSGINTYIGTSPAFTGDVGIYLSGSTSGMYLTVCGHGPIYSGGPTGDIQMCPLMYQSSYAFQVNKAVHFVINVDEVGFTAYADAVPVQFVAWSAVTPSTVAVFSNPLMLPVFHLKPTVFIDSLSWIVRDLVIHSHPPSLSNLLTMKSCQLQQVIPHCWLPPLESAALNLTTWVATANENTQLRGSSALFVHKLRAACLAFSSGRIISRSPLADSLYTTDAIPSLPFDTAFSLLMWLPFNRLTPVGISKSYLWISSSLGLTLAYDRLADSNTGNVFILQHDFGSGCRQYGWSNADFASMSVSSSVTEFMSLIFSASTVSMYRNGINGGSARSVGACTFVAPYTSLVSPEMIFYFPISISPSQLEGEMLCQLNTFSMSNGLNNRLSTAMYSTPIAVCEAEEGASNNAYCRHAMMCGGSCSAYSILDHVAHTFTPLQVVCDPGWMAPDCAVRCTNLDSNGACVVQLQSLAVIDSPVSGLSDAYSPNGYWCQVLKQQQTAEKITGGADGAQFFVTFSARSYEYLVDVTVPSGQITSLVGTSQCPSISMQSDGSGSLFMLLTNTGINLATLRILTASESSCQSPLPCCIHEYSLTVPAFRSVSWPVPSICAQQRITIEVNQGTSSQVCRVISATTASAEAFAAIAAPLTSNVQRSLVVTGNEVLMQLAENNQRLAATMFQLQSAAIRSLAAGIDNSAAIDQMVQEIALIPLGVINSTYLASLSNPFNSNDEWNRISATIHQLQADAAAGTASVSNSSYTLAGLTRVFSELAAQTRENTEALQVKVAALQAQTLLTNNQFNQTIYEMEAARQNFADAIALIESNIRKDVVAEASLSDTTLGLLIAGSVLGALAGFTLIGWAVVKLSSRFLKRNSAVQSKKTKRPSSSDESESSSSSSGEEEDEESEESESGSSSSGSESSDDDQAAPSMSAQAAIAIAKAKKHFRDQQA